MEKYVAVYHIGPVQDFIASARRSRDLWFGSWLLNELARAAALKIVEHHSNSIDCLVFPYPDDLNMLKSSDFICPNKVIAIVSEPLEVLGKKVEQAVKEKLILLSNQTYNNHVKGKINRCIADEQVEDLLEFYWSAYVYDNDYGKARQYAEAVMAARKVTRDFNQVSWGDNLPKSSLDGARESVIPEKEYDECSEIDLRKKYGIRKGERLCGVGLLKRHGMRGEGDRFLSTSHVAALPLLGRLKDKKATNIYIEGLKKLGLSSADLGTQPKKHPVFEHNDGYLLFEERLSEFIDEESAEEAKQLLNDFKKKALDDKNPTPYYALLLGDGDYMGQIIDAQKTVEDHRNFSSKLSSFSKEVRDIIKKYDGSLVYSGGDDVLAFLPLHTVLQCARELSNSFSNSLASFELTDNTGKTIRPSLSVGIVVSHHVEPLADALFLVREAEKKAKSQKGKNALAVTVNKRSGSERTISGKWDSLYERLILLIHLYQEEQLPEGFAYELKDLSQTFSHVSAKDQEKVNNIIELEAVRIMQRKRVEGGKKTIDDAVLQKLKSIIASDEISVGEFADEMIIAGIFASCFDLAQTVIPEKY